MRQVFEFDFALPGLNGSKGLIRSHWTSRSKMKESIFIQVLEKEPRCHEGKVRITYKRVSPKLLDWDNCMSSLKNLLDAFVKAGTIKDDSPKFIPEPPELVQETGKAWTQIVIEDLA